MVFNIVFGQGISWPQGPQLNYFLETMALEDHGTPDGHNRLFIIFCQVRGPP